MPADHIALLCTITEHLEICRTSKSGLRWIKKPYRSATKAGDDAGSLGANGYFDLRVAGHRVYAHRAVFLMANGLLPKFIDHIDGNRCNNDPANLREASRSQNAKNSAIRNDNTSGARGVYWEASTRKWRGFVHIDGKIKRKRFEDLASAVEWRRLQEITHYGEFSPLECRIDPPRIENKGSINAR